MAENEVKKAVEPAFEPEKTVTKTLNLGGRQGLPMRVDVKNGRIIRIRPLHFDEKYITGAYPALENQSPG